ncbi:MAG: PD40 domain-containing protein [Solirubrobacterales bacterium]|nr:PD40 domain-containing protein [Solirubrobacterales bacterium]OJU94455.1 MAG: hypothetical protein BGO23_03365 [Solirubrobacterales bacterium 67-14]
MKRLLVVLLIGMGVLAFAGGAEGASLVYLDQSGDVAAARANGSAAGKLVSNGLKKGPIAVDGKGRIAYYQKADGSPFHYLIDKDGKNLSGPWLFNDMGICGAISPFRLAASPDGTWLAATYIRGNDCSNATFSVRTRLIDSDGPTLNEGVYGATTDLVEPRFLPQDQPRLSGVISNQINIWRSPSDPVMEPWISLNDPNWDIDSFDYDPTRNRMIMEQSLTGQPDGGKRRDFLLVDFDSPGGALNPVCAYDGLVAKTADRARPRYSPDGKQIAWSGPAGIYVSPAPTDNGGTCTLSPKLVVPGGSQVEWAPFDLASPPAAKLRITGVSGTTRAGFRKGATVKVTAPASGKVTVKATVSKTAAKKLKLAKKPRGPMVVASGSKKAAKAGDLAIKLKPTAKVKSAWRKLAGVRVTLKAVQGSRSATRTVKLTR